MANERTVLGVYVTGSNVDGPTIAALSLVAAVRVGLAILLVAGLA